ncbi:MAG: ABC transporter ATP-binding protein [Lachnospiraceae bacterium]
MEKLELVNISKQIKKNKILTDVCLTMEKGKIYGFVGANGSGKTMLFRTIAGLIRPTGGYFILDGKKLSSMLNVKIDVGILIENISLYLDMTGFQNLKYLASVNRKITDDEIKASIEAVGLDPEDKRKLSKYSLGMKQKIVLAQAVMEHPDLILLDEPTNGLDKESVQKIRKLIKTEAGRGAVIAIASHNEQDILECCDECFKIEAGIVAPKLNYL